MEKKVENAKAFLVEWKREQQAKAERRERASRWDESADFIVIGAGSSGCALSARLYQGVVSLPPSRSSPDDDDDSVDQGSDVRVLLLEAGTHDYIPQIQTAVDYFGKVESVFGSSRDWLYDSEPQKELNGRGFYWPRGKVIGGCSSFNTMVWLRAPPSDFHNWEKLLGGATDWGYASMLAAYKRAETHPYATEKGLTELHGTSGPIRVAPLFHASHHPDDATNFITKAFVAAAKRLGVQENLDFGLRTLGVGVNDVNAFHGQRCNAAAYLKMIDAYPRPENITNDFIGPFVATEDKLFKVRTKTMVTRILFDDDDDHDDNNQNDNDNAHSPRAIGVEIIVRDDDSEEDDDDANKVRRFRIRARREVIVSGGAVNTPQLLLLSGIGERAHLEDVGISCRADVPGVGKNLKDHLHVPMCYKAETQRVVPHSHSNICEGSLFTTLDPEAPSPDLQVHIGTLFFDPQVFSPLGEGFTLTPSLIRPRSTGRILLRSNDPFDRPRIFANYLSDPRDVQTLVDGVKFVRALGMEMMHSAVSGIEGTEVYPGNEVVSDAEIEEYVRTHAGTMYHPTSTCKIGLDDDPDACLDVQLRVRGVRNLRVCDASVMPDIIGSNTNATCVALGEKAAEIILRDLARTNTSADRTTPE